MLAALNIKIPKNQTAAMQLLQLYMQSGHYFWISGIVARAKLHRLVAKLNAFRIARDAPGRAYDKTKGLASTHLVVFEQGDDELLWLLAGTKGKGGLIDPEQIDIGRIYDARLAGQHLRFKHYELLHTEKRIGQIRDTTWTWRIAPQRVKEHEAFIVHLVRQRDREALNTELAALAAMPLFSGVRGQVLKLFAETKKLSLKFKLGEVTVPTLPYMTRLPVYAEPATTLKSLMDT